MYLPYLLSVYLLIHNICILCPLESKSNQNRLILTNLVTKHVLQEIRLTEACDFKNRGYNKSLQSPSSSPLNHVIQENGRSPKARRRRGSCHCHSLCNHKSSFHSQCSSKLKKEKNLNFSFFFINRAKRAVSKIQNQNLSSLMSFVQLTQKSILIPNSLKISLSETSFLLVEVRTLLAWQLFTLEFQLKLRSIPSIDSALQDCRLLTRLRTRSG